MFEKNYKGTDHKEWLFRLICTFGFSHIVKIHFSSDLAGIYGPLCNLHENGFK